MPENKEIAAAHRLIPEINAHYRSFKKSIGEGLNDAIKIGELLLTMKEALPHGEFVEAVEKRCEFDIRWGQTCMKVAGGQELLKKIDQKPESIVEAIKLINEHKPKTKSQRISPPSGNDSISDQGKPGGAVATSSTHGPVSSDPVTGEAADSSGEDERTEAHGQEAQETGSRPPRSGKDKPGKVDYGKCPNCAGTKWNVDEFGFVDCAKCHHPHGEPVGDRSEDADPAGIKRAKAVKTCEALMREFDDLNLILPKAGSHKQAIELCKNLLKSAKGWK